MQPASIMIGSARIKPKPKNFLADLGSREPFGILAVQTESDFHIPLGKANVVSVAATTAPLMRDIIN